MKSEDGVGEKGFFQFLDHALIMFFSPDNYFEHLHFVTYLL